ncbi:MAG: response regulator [Desulfatitalea sp.]|nr:response regulator [Desulfatitalea sp.]
MNVMLVTADAILAGQVRDGMAGIGSLMVAASLQNSQAPGASAPIDAILLDLHLPDSDGLEILAQMQSTFQAAPVIVLGDVHDERLVLPAARLGARGFLFKQTITGTRLADLLHLAVARHHDRQWQDQYCALNKEAYNSDYQSEEKYRYILENIEDIYFESDLKGNLTYFNPTLAERMGYTREEMQGTSCRAYLDEKNAHICIQALKEIYKTGRPNPSLQYEVIHRDGTIRAMESSVSPIKSESGAIVGFCGISRDITERKSMERALADAKERANAAIRAKDEFLANLSHEIRTPMNGIIGMYNLLLSTDLDPQQTDYALTGKRSAQTLLVVINNILDFSRIEAGKLAIETVDFDLRGTIEDMVDLLSAQAHAKGLEFIYDICHEVPSLLMGDPGRLRQVLMILIHNAIKFTDQGEVAFFTTLEAEDERTAVIRFTVRDTGIGICADDQAHLFKSFQQVDTSTTRKYGGAGLGLAISKRLAELMGGRMDLESEPGKGATFWFTAAFTKAAAADPRTANLSDALRDKRILIVDDNQSNLDVLDGYLALWGSSCDRASSGDAALSLMRAVASAGAPYDMVICDRVMPGMDGVALGRHIKIDPELKDTLLVMLASQGLPCDAAEMKRIGFSAYLTKPTSRSHLYDCLSIVLNRKEELSSENKPAPLVTSHMLTEDRRRKIRILLAEDNPIDQKFARHLLDRFGFGVDTVPNGKTALTALAARRYDLVLMDVQMPGMDGFEATSSIRAAGVGARNHDIPIIAMTAHNQSEDRERCIAAGMSDYIRKPIQPEELLKAIERAIAAGPVRQAATEKQIEGD